MLVLKFARINQGLSQQAVSDLAAVPGLTQMRVGEIERRRWNPNERELAGLSRALGVPAAELLKDIPDPLAAFPTLRTAESAK